MSIRKKMTLALLILLAISIGVLYWVVSSVLLKGFYPLEEKSVADNSDRLKSAFIDQYDELHTLAKDWANWDDAFSFVRKPTDTFIKANFVDSIFTGSRLSLIAYLDLNGKVVCGREFDPAQGKQVPISESVAKLITQERIYKHQTVSDVSKGLFLLPGGPFIVAAVGVTGTSAQPPVVGSVVFGRYFSQEEMKLLASKTRLDVSFALTSDRGLITPDDANRLQVSRASEDQISGSSAITDVDGQPALHYRINMRRDIYQEARKSLTMARVILVISGLLYILAIFVLLSRMVVSRILHIHRHLERVVATEDYDSLLTIEGKDEISNLEEAINGLLAAESTIFASIGRE